MGNRLDDAAINDIFHFVERVPGVTSVQKDPATGDIRAKSGAQTRLVVALEDQTLPDPNAPPDATAGDDFFSEDPSGTATDAFLSTGAGVTAQTRLQGPNA